MNILTPSRVTRRVCEEVAQYATKSIFCKNRQLLPWKEMSPKIWAAAVPFKKLPKESNRPNGEHSPNLVTLTPSHPAQIDSSCGFETNWH
jgi:hypothetical protein